MITERQEKILNALVREYICNAEPIGSLDLKKVAGLDISPATVRNDFQELTKAGYIQQPHTSAGRIPTKKAYKYFSDKIAEEKQNEFEEFIVQQIEFAHRQIEREMKLAEEIMETLEQDNLFEILNILEIWHKKTKN